MGLQELPPPATAVIWAALQPADRGALRAASSGMREAMNACVARVTVDGDGTSGCPAAELPRLPRRFPGLRELRFEPSLGNVLSPFPYLLPALEALPPACFPALERAGGREESRQHPGPLAAAQLARLCPGLTRVGISATIFEHGGIGPALEALADGCHRLASVDLQMGFSLDHVGCTPHHASAEAVAAAAAGLRRLGGGLRELSVVFGSSETEEGSTAASTLLPAVLPSLTALSSLTVWGESGVVVGAPCGSLEQLNLSQAAAVGGMLRTVQGPIPGVTSLCIGHSSDW
jgi:hypothetical protein